MKNQNRKVAAQSRRAERRTILWVAVLTLAVASAMLYSSFEGRSMAVRYAPLVDAAMEIKLEIALARLGFEEVLGGDTTVTLTDVWKHLDETEWYARAMLEGGENPVGKFIPLEDPDLRREIELTLEKINAYRTIVEERWEAQTSSEIGSDID
ncbi:hypothetical protein KKA00_13335, partial [bacterium]|nr:hypothetical protein [bacterium]